MWGLAIAAVARAADDRVVADFDADAYPPGWVTTGTAFGTGPAHGTLPGQQRVSGFVGRGLVDTYLGGDGPTGTLTSPPFAVERDYLNLLVGGGAHPGRACVNLLLDGKVVRSATGADDEQLTPVTWDVRPLRDKSVVIQIVDAATGRWGHVNVDQIVQSDTPADPWFDAPLRHERYRPQFHFTPAHGWMNDPNGLVFADGEYHLFFQHNPDSLRQTPVMSWGHAVSPDLVHWTQLPIALSPDEHGYIWSGSAVVDRDNTSGLGTPGHPPLVAMYTAAAAPFAQCIASSTDRGRTWAKFPGNPVIPHLAGENRDPHVIWYPPTRRWVVVLYKDVADTFCLFDSPDLIHWTHLQDQRLPGCSECPDFFPLPLDGNPANTLWVFTAADGRYLVGTFDGHTFAPEQGVRQVDFGRNEYAVQTYSDTPDGRRIQIAWMRDGRYPRMPFNQQMSFPAELTLHATPDGPRLFRMPVAEIAKLRAKTHTWTDLTVSDEKPLDGLAGDLFEVSADIDVGTAAEVGLVVRGEPITCSVKNHTLTALGTAPLNLVDGRLTLRVLVDRTSIETFANSGRVSLTSCFLPTQEGIALFARGGTAKVKSLEVTELKSAW